MCINGLVISSSIQESIITHMYSRVEHYPVGLLYSLLDDGAVSPRLGTDITIMSQYGFDDCVPWGFLFLKDNGTLDLCGNGPLSEFEKLIDVNN